MARSHSRIFFSVAVGVLAYVLEPGYVGSLAFPGLVVIWFWSVLISIFVGGAKATLALLIVPSMFGNPSLASDLHPFPFDRSPSTACDHLNGFRSQRLRGSLGSIDHLC